jgi:hypothetical protein
MLRHEKFCGSGHFHSDRDLCRAHWRQSRLLRVALSQLNTSSSSLRLLCRFARFPPLAFHNLAPPDAWSLRHRRPFIHESREKARVSTRTI